MRWLASLGLIVAIGLSIIGCRKAEEQSPPPGAVKEVPGMTMQAPVPGRQGRSGIQVSPKRPER